MSYLLVNIDLFGSHLGSPREIHSYINKLTESKVYGDATTLVQHTKAHMIALGELDKDQVDDAISIITNKDGFLDMLSQLNSLEPYVVIKLDMPEVVAVPKTPARTTSPC